MQDIIKKAIEGGFIKGKAVMNELTDEIYLRANPEMFTLDSLFWQALGKACGWDMEPNYTSPCFDGMISEPECQAIRFHEINIREGWDKAISYLEDLIK